MSMNRERLFAGQIPNDDLVHRKPLATNNLVGVDTGNQATDLRASINTLDDLLPILPKLDLAV